MGGLFSRSLCRISAGRILSLLRLRRVIWGGRFTDDALGRALVKLHATEATLNTATRWRRRPGRLATRIAQRPSGWFSSVLGREGIYGVDGSTRHETVHPTDDESTRHSHRYTEPGRPPHRGAA